jgi:hypothetical protein
VCKPGENDAKGDWKGTRYKKTEKNQSTDYLSNAKYRKKTKLNKLT